MRRSPVLGAVIAILAGAVTAVFAPAGAPRAQAAPVPPGPFLWGVATSGYQSEG